MHHHHHQHWGSSCRSAAFKRTLASYRKALYRSGEGLPWYRYAKAPVPWPYGMAMCTCYRGR